MAQVRALPPQTFNGGKPVVCLIGPTGERYRINHAAIRRLSPKAFERVKGLLRDVSAVEVGSF